MDIVKELWAVIKKEKIIIAISVVLFVSVAGILSAQQTVVYDGSFYATLKKMPVVDAGNFEGIYHIQLSEKVADFLSGWLAAQVRESAELASIGDFSARMVSFEIIGVRFASPDRVTADLLREKTSALLRQKIQQLNKEIFFNHPFIITMSDMKFASRPVAHTPRVVGGFFFGLCFGLFLALMKHYYRKA